MNSQQAVRARRAIPAVERVLQALGEGALPRALVVDIVRAELAVLRENPEALNFEEVLGRVRAALARVERTRLRRVVNATGVLVHTNLGRSPMSPAAVALASGAAGHYSNLELDLCSGERGGRGDYVERGLARLAGAEAATLVNNCAAALVLILRHFTAGECKEVVISRGELIQIGGGFRVPDILETSGARLREVGTTNKTTLEDYARALGPATALILKVHRSNFFMDGFVAQADTAELAALARKRRLPLVEDLGSGACIATERCAGLEHEPTPAEVLKRGVDLVCYSGDKLLGGPQAGIIAGRSRWIKSLKRDPLFRALRCDKMVFAAMQATLDYYLDAESGGNRSGGGPVSADRMPPLLRMLELGAEELRQRAERLAERMTGLPLEVRVGESTAQMGGGTLPRAAIPSVALELKPRSGAPSELLARLREAPVPVIGYVSGGRVKLDMRTISADEEEWVAQAVRSAVQGGGS